MVSRYVELAMKEKFPDAGAEQASDPSMDICDRVVSILNDPALDGVGPQYMPRMDAWKNHVAAVASRYKGRIKAYQVWNEANIVNYWAQNRHNTPFAMARLTDAAYGTIKSIDPSALVVGPAFATRLSWQQEQPHWRGRRGPGKAHERAEAYLHRYRR